MQQRPVKLAVVCAVDWSLKALLLPQMTAAQKQGYEVHGISSKGRYYPFLQERGFIMYPVTITRSMTPWRDLLALGKMARYFKREGIGIVHTHTPKCSLLGQLAAKLAGVPIVINTVHGFYFHEHMKPGKRKFYIAMEWIAARCSTLIFSQNPEDMETALKYGIGNPKKLTLLGNGVDLSKFDVTRFDRSFRCAKRTEIGVPPKATVLGIIGRLVKEKGYLELFEAMRELMRENQNLWLVIAGAEELHKKDRISTAAFHQYGIEERTLWLGRRQDIPEILSCFDIFVLPSWREGFPRSAIEAAAMGLPIVATNIRGCRQIVEDGVNGYLTPVKDSRALAGTVRKLLTDEPTRKRMGQAGHQKAQVHFNEQRVIETILSAYASLKKEYLS